MATQFFFQKDELVPIDIESSFLIRVMSVRGLNPPQPKELFTRDWAGEDGVDVYLPASRKKKAQEVVMTCYAQDHSLGSAIESYDNFCEYIFNGEIWYHDDVQAQKVKLIYMGNKPAWYQFVSKRKLVFEVTFLNKTGNREFLGLTPVV